MDTETGRLRRLMEGEEPPEGFKRVPEEFADEANRILGNDDEAVADMSKDTPLVMWAKQVERDKTKAKRRARNKVAKASRRKNRK